MEKTTSEILGVTSTFTDYASAPTNPNEKLSQDYRLLKSKKEHLERDLKTAKDDIIFDLMRRSPTNKIQLGIDLQKLSSSIRRLEMKRGMELQAVQDSYFFKINKRFMTENKRQKLSQQLQKEEEIINAKYNLLLEQYNQKRVKLEMDLAASQKAEKEAIEESPTVKELKSKLEKVQEELIGLEEKLGYQTKTSSYTSGYSAKM